MPSYNHTKQAMMKAYPRLFMDEWDVLDHLFFVVGNGYYWDNGELSEKISLEEMISRAKADRVHADKLSLDAWNRADKFFAKLGKNHSPYEPYETDDDERNRNKEYEFRRIIAVKEFDECYFILDDGVTIGHKIYSVSSYSKILNIPDDIKSDWLEAAKMAIKIARSPKARASKNDLEQLDIAENRVKQILAMRKEV